MTHYAVFIRSSSVPNVILYGIVALCDPTISYNRKYDPKLLSGDWSEVDCEECLKLRSTIRKHVIGGLK